jgi:hypothetical protein
MAVESSDVKKGSNISVIKRGLCLNYTKCRPHTLTLALGLMLEKNLLFHMDLSWRKMDLSSSLGNSEGALLS